MPMRFLADENMSRTVIERLRLKGHDVLSAKKSLRGKSDEAILRRAQREKRVVVTHDKGFGELAFRRGLTAAYGVILLRLSGTDPDADIRRAVHAIDARDDWGGHFSAITDTAIRMRTLPAGRGSRQ